MIQELDDRQVLLRLANIFEVCAITSSEFPQDEHASAQLLATRLMLAGISV